MRRAASRAAWVAAIAAPLIASGACGSSSTGGGDTRVSGCPAPAFSGLAVHAFHGDRARLGWNDAEPVLTPARIAAGFGPAWESPAFDAATIDGVTYAGRAYASPLYVDGVTVRGGAFDGQTFDIVFVATSNGDVYAMNAFATACARGSAPAGAVLWKTRVATPSVVPVLDAKAPFGGVPLGVLSTPVIDPARGRLYVVAMDKPVENGGGAAPAFRAYALDLASGAIADGYPLTLDAAAIEPVNGNGPTAWDPVATEHSQRSALALSPASDGRDRLYIAFGGYADRAAGWIVAVDVSGAPRVAASFSSARGAPLGVANGGLWAAGGPAVDDDGSVSMPTGNGPPEAAMANAPAMWGNSYLVWTRDLALAATYTPWNYCQSEVGDTDLGGSSPLLLPSFEAATTSTPRLVAFGSKQGTMYLLDRDHLHGALDVRPPCSASARWSDAAQDTSLLPPPGAPYCDPASATSCARGPLSVFGPYSDGPEANKVDSAKMRSAPAFFRDAAGDAKLFVSGTTKSASDDLTDVPPSLARLRVVLAAGQPAYLAIDAVDPSLAFVNPGSPVVSSDGPRDPVVWVVDQNARRTQPLLDPATPHPVLYAVDGATMKPIYASAPADLHVGGKYVTPVIAHGTVLVATDRLQAFAPR